MAATTSMTKFDLTHDNVTDVIATATGIVAAAGKLAIPLGRAKQAVLHVKNADAAADAYVTIKAGGGIRKALGDMIVKVETGNEAKIKIADTARFMVLTGDDAKSVIVEFNDNEGKALASGVLEDLTVWAVLL